MTNSGYPQQAANALYLEKEFNLLSNRNETTWYEHSMLSIPATNSALTTATTNFASTTAATNLPVAQRSNLASTVTAPVRDIFQIMTDEEPARRPFFSNKRRKWLQYVNDPTRPQNVLLDDPHLPPSSEMHRRNTLLMKHKFGEKFQENFNCKTVKVKENPTIVDLQNFCKEANVPLKFVAN